MAVTTSASAGTGQWLPCQTVNDRLVQMTVPRDLLARVEV